MKAFIIHTTHKKSISYAKNAFNSFNDYTGWEPALFNGLEPATLNNDHASRNIKLKIPSRAMTYKNKKSITKKCCSLNHYNLFKKCLEINEPIAVIEHDSHCVGDWINIEFDEVLILNAISALNQPVLAPIKEKNKNYQFKTGIHDINLGMVYNLIDPALKGQHIMPGTAAYAITPNAAKKMIYVYENIGWEQSDFIINTAYVRIQTLVPELFTFKLPNLSMSNGHYS